ncbi:MAG: Hpt domain-containing protein [Rhodocyclaceae bacterium]|nr:Hpt domain-containing protein [Rhodocyclaceae bacterium]
MPATSGFSSKARAAMVSAFITEAPRLLAVIRSGLDEADAKSIALAAHSLKGSAGSSGPTNCRRCAKRSKLWPMPAHSIACAAGCLICSWLSTPPLHLCSKQTTWAHEASTPDQPRSRAIRQVGAGETAMTATVAMLSALRQALGSEP